MVSGAYDEEDVRVLVGVTQGCTTRDHRLDFWVGSGCFADKEAFVRADEEVIISVDEA